MGLFTKNVKKETVVVEGMKCIHCVNKVKDALKALKVKAEIGEDKKLVIVSYNPDKISLEQIKKAIEEVGFQCV